MKVRAAVCAVPGWSDSHKAKVADALDAHLSDCGPSRALRLLGRVRRILGAASPGPSLPVAPLRAVSLDAPAPDLQACRCLDSTMTLPELLAARQRVMRVTRYRQPTVLPVQAVTGGCHLCGADASAFRLDTVSGDSVCTSCGCAAPTGPCYPEPGPQGLSPAFGAVQSYAPDGLRTTEAYKRRDIEDARSLIQHVADRHRLGQARCNHACGLYTAFRIRMENVEKRLHVIAACIDVATPA